MSRTIIGLLLLALLVVGCWGWGYWSGLRDKEPAADREDYPALALGIVLRALIVGLIMAGVSRFLMGWENRDLPIAFGCWFLAELFHEVGRAFGRCRRDLRMRLGEYSGR